MNKRSCRCGQPLSNVRRVIARVISGNEITINNVPVLYCESCGEALFTSKAIKKMDELIQNNPGELVLEYPNDLELMPPVIYFLDSLGTDKDSDEPLTKADLANLIALIKSKGEVA